ncbi:hypothetical protein AAGS40_29605 (plasmid) [Paraburkholderia sp. PREW-6R]|uniref:hypothetical protein n=1 Tax=Paraburkholderia sp. PREW-6R TaxID=3141544 RepID=UPI0031F52559
MPGYYTELLLYFIVYDGYDCFDYMYHHNEQIQERHVGEMAPEIWCFVRLARRYEGTYAVLMAAATSVAER